MGKVSRAWTWRSNQDPVDIYEVLEDPDHPIFPDLGRLLFSLVATQPSWIYRRVDTATLIQERHVRRHMSVDLRVPPSVTELAGELKLERFVVPLRFVMRQSLLSFDLHLGNEPVPLLTREQNIMATRALLQAAVEEYGIEPDEELRAMLAQVASADTTASEETLELLGLAQPDPDVTPTVEEALLRWAIVTFDRNYLLLADVPLSVIRNRTIFKVTQELTDPPDPFPGTLEQLRARIAWDPVSIVFDTPDVTTANSYHFQFIAPVGLMISGGALLAADEESNQTEPFGVTASRTSVLGLNAHPEEVPEADSYGALVQVRPSPDGLLRASAASAALSTALLLLAGVMAPHLDAEQASSSTTLLLVILGVLSTFLARPGEHSLVAHALRGVRVLTIVSAMTTYVAAAVLVFSPGSTTLRTSWLVLAGVSAIPTLALGEAVRRSRAAQSS